MRLSFRVSRTAFVLGLASWFLLTPTSQTLPPSGTAKERVGPEKPPWLRQLTGADAKRVQELEKKVEELRQAGQFAAAQVPARDILAIRTRVQGKDHWETVSMHWTQRTLEQIAALAPKAQAELVQADKHYADAQVLNRLYQN
jgi:hypothetical protein